MQPLLNPTAPKRKTFAERPPVNTLRVNRWADLQPALGFACFRIKNGAAEPYKVCVQKHAQQILKTLMQRPIYCSSICRISHFINVLRDDYGVEIETQRYQGNPKTGQSTFGVYFLKSDVSLIQRGAL